MHGLVGGVLVAAATFVGTMFDDTLLLAAQLRLTEGDRQRRIGWAHALAIGSLVVIASSVASVLTVVPLRLVGLMALVAWAHAIVAWRRPSTHAHRRRGGVTTYAHTLVRGGSPLAVWIPILRATSLTRAVLTVGVFALGEYLVYVSARVLSRRASLFTSPRPWTSRTSAALYLALGVLVIGVCHTI